MLLPSYAHLTYSAGNLLGLLTNLPRVSRAQKRLEFSDQTDPIDLTVDEWHATVFDHDKVGRVEDVTDPLSHITSFTFDGAGRRTEWQDHLGNKIAYGYSGDCCTATEIEEIEKKPGGGTETFRTELVVDAFKRVTTRRYVDRDNSSNKHTWTYKYSSLNVMVEQTDAEGNQTTWEHDGRGLVTRKDVDLGSSAAITTQWTYDDNGRQASIKDDATNTTSYTYTARDQRKTLTYPDTEVQTWTYFATGQVSGWTDPNGTVVANTLDNDGRLTARDITLGTGVYGPEDESYTYDGLGRLTEATNDNSVVQRSYDTLSRLTAETQGPNPLSTYGKTVSHEYDDDGSRSTLTYPSSYELTYTVDAVGRWTKIENSASDDLVTWSYFGPGRRIETATYDNGASENYVYDGFRRITDLDHKDGATVLMGFDYAYDKVGNPLWEEWSHDSGKGNAYAYDKAYRLTAALMEPDDPSAEVADSDWLDYDHDEVIEYNMDDDGNRTSVVTTPDGGSAATVSYTDNTLNQYTAIASVSRTHDDNGNLTDDGTRTYYYSYRNELLEVRESSTTLGEYTFDALGRRVTKEVDSVVTRFIYDGIHVIEEYEDGTLARKFVQGQGIDQPVAMIAPDVADLDEDMNTSELVSLYYHRDRLGSIRGLTSDATTIVESYQYSPYGEVTVFDASTSEVGSSPTGNPLDYIARRRDEESGTMHVRARSYDPGEGQFLQRDPAGYAFGTRLQQYALSSPTVWVDLTGAAPKPPTVSPPQRVAALRPSASGRFGVASTQALQADGASHIIQVAFVFFYSIDKNGKLHSEWSKETKEWAKTNEHGIIADGHESSAVPDAPWAGECGFAVLHMMTSWAGTVTRRDGAAMTETSSVSVTAVHDFNGTGGPDARRAEAAARASTWGDYVVSPSFREAMASGSAAHWEWFYKVNWCGENQATLTYENSLTGDAFHYVHGPGGAYTITPRGSRRPGPGPGLDPKKERSGAVAPRPATDVEKHGRPFGF